MPGGDKPYRVYRGGRTKGRVPGPSRQQRPPRAEAREERARPPRARRSRDRRRLTRWVLLALGLLVVFLAVWGALGYLAFRDGVGAANERLGRDAERALTAEDGLLLSRPTNILLLGTDSAPIEQRRGARHSDSIMLVRTDPDRHRVVYLSIPRDLLVPIPGEGDGRITNAFQIGGAPLAIRAIANFTGLPINHVVVVDFATFEQLIDALGGIDVDVPRPIVSNRFDCPYATQERCNQWEGWRFRAGEQHMSGRRALIYARIRSNRLDRSENDISRGERQQAVMQATLGKLASVGTFLRLPFSGDELLSPVATDLSAGEFVQLGWVKWRSGGSAYRCRLGGYPDSFGGASVLRPSEENRGVIATFLGQSAPQPPPPGSGLFGAGCVTGSGALGNR